MENNNKVSIIQRLNEATPTQIVNIPEVANRFKDLYVTFNGKDGARYYEAEKFHFAKRIQESEELQKCSKLSLYGCFLDMAVNGLSFDPAMNHAYIVPMNVKTIKEGKEVWEKRAQLRISGQGELIMRIQQGQIKYADNPILVYEGDRFLIGNRDNAIFVDHESVFPRKSDNIIGCYLRITRADESVDYKIISMPEVQKLRKFSKQPDSIAWTDGLPGMIQTKCIKHAFKSYPRIRILDRTKFTQLASEVIDQEPEAHQDLYGLNGELQNSLPEKQPEITPHENVSTLEDEFAKPEKQNGGKTFDEDDF